MIRSLWVALRLRLAHRRADRLTSLLASSRAITRGVVLALLTGVAHDAEAETGKATRFAYVGDRQDGDTMRCLGRRLYDGEQGIAHRTLPCGTLVRVTNLRTGRSVVAPVVDRGPWGAMLDGAWVVKRRRRDPGVWRGIADLAPATVAALQHRSFDRVRLDVLTERAP